MLALFAGSVVAVNLVVPFDQCGGTPSLHKTLSSDVAEEASRPLVRG